MADKNSFVLFYENREVFDELPDEDCAALIRGIFQYEVDGIEPELSLAAKCVFLLIKQQLDRNRKKYEEKTKARSVAGKKSAEARANKRQQNPTKGTNVKFVEQTPTNPTDSVRERDSDSDSVRDSVRDSVKGVKGGKRKRFTPPAKEDIIDYANEKGIVIDAEKFVDYYESNGWRVGKNPMKDWKATVRNWARRSDMDKPRSGTKRDMSKEEYLAYWGLNGGEIFDHQ